MAEDKAAWTSEDDKKLRTLVEKHGTNGKWAMIAIEADFGHNSESCKLRWNTFANPKNNVFTFGGAGAGGAVEGKAVSNAADFRPKMKPNLTEIAA